KDMWSNVVAGRTGGGEVVEGYPELGPSVVRTRHLRSLGVGHALPAFCHYLFHCIDPDTADDFVDRLGSDANHEEGDPILALRRKLLPKPGPGLSGGKGLTTRQ